MPNNFVYKQLPSNKLPIGKQNLPGFLWSLLNFFMGLRPDQFNLLLLGYCEVKIGPSDRKKKDKSNQLGCDYRPQSN